MSALQRPQPRPGVLAIDPYVPGKSTAPGVAGVFKLSSNETPLGPSPKAVAAYRAVLEPARRVLRDQKFLAGEEPAYPDYALAGAFLWARIASPLELLELDDPVSAWRERMLDLFDGVGRKAKAA